MFQLTPAHLQAMDAASHAHYRQQLAEDLAEFASRLCEVAGVQAVNEFIDCGLKKAESHNLTLQGSVRFYIELMASFGWRFDEDPQYQGLVRHLPLIEMAEVARVELMYDAYSTFFDKTIGARNQKLVAALKRLLNLDLEALADSREQLSSQATQLLASLYPEKAAAIGAVALQQAVNVSIQAAMKMGATGRLSQLTAITLSYFIGIGFYDDPLYAWIDCGASENDGEKRFLRIRTKALTYAMAVIDYWEHV